MNYRHQCRHPQIGDLLFVTCRKSDYNDRCFCQDGSARHVGIVREIEHDSYGHQKHVHIEWSSTPPLNYREEYGYSGTNIHNIRSEFQIVRDGVCIK